MALAPFLTHVLTLTRSSELPGLSRETTWSLGREMSPGRVVSGRVMSYDLDLKVTSDIIV